MNEARMQAEETEKYKPTLNKKLEAAKERWKLLAQILYHGKKPKDTSKNVVSIRRFQTFGLFDIKQTSENNECQWFKYKSNLVDALSLDVRHLCGSMNADKLTGFNNTGNVCIWPAEEIMAFYCLKKPEYFRDKSVIELGGGMSCLAGFSVAIGTDASLVQVTDGNEDSVENLEVMVTENQEKYKNTRVKSSLFRWGAGKLDKSLQEQFDVVLCSDCLFFEEGRKDLITTMHNLLKPQGEVIILAPKRGTTFDTFTKLAQELFHTEISTNYDAQIWKLHSQFKGDQLYDENIHFPVLLNMKMK